ncbi:MULTISPECIES: NAD(P)/FAD-dependent oxidoreductase [unclassified Streptomyces]|uniref:NAD(P)/FAD-dependent oxidoreductase n=1 Tax=unclassified Streptomyces TaxID=2593676 RepID=UPI00088CBDF9|nr:MULTISPECIES: FAD-dependent oxidoreductase [unclassified Streptomyces]PBC84162.1 NADH dehydrogenase FAD-containing subunit [Streptomyces sp. 2321.6]SDR34314.1 NADH dehydrogenase, FAD-containing subunit [Streptomyces sp. KS_16]SED21905.1 NADH dehydrogenase, FAD-containing subunit [Streptomyces sp. 2133.1]SNC70244.1 NADH dehydrogenase, FAD-containing subunit [Streptomyces sp. 2114.4]
MKSVARQRLRVVVLGGGYAGTMAALRLAPYAQVTLVDPSDRFTERVRLHELAAGRPVVDHSRAAMLHGTGIEHLAARATALDPDARAVHTDCGRTLLYDRLVYTLGSHTDLRSADLRGTDVRSADVRGADLRGTGPSGAPARGPWERAFTAESAVALHKRLRDGPGTLAVVGGGLTGIEMAAEIAESHPGWQVRLLTGGVIGAGLSARGREHVRTVLDRLHVRVEEGRRVADGDDTDADAVLWTGAMTAAGGLARDAGLDTDPVTGRILVDGALRSASHPDVYAAGDAAAARTPRAGALRMACATALPTGSHVAGAIIAESRGAVPRPLSYTFFVQCVSLGRHDGLIQSLRADDTPRERVLTGRPAARVKEQVVRNAVRVLRLAARRPDVVGLIPGIGR